MVATPKQGLPWWAQLIMLVLACLGAMSALGNRLYFDRATGERLEERVESNKEILREIRTDVKAINDYLRGPPAH